MISSSRLLLTPRPGRSSVGEFPTTPGDDMAVRGLSDFADGCPEILVCSDKDALAAAAAAAEAFLL